MSDGGNGAIWAAITAGVLAILGSAIGSVFQGYSNVQLEKAQLESRLILKALEPDEPEQRRETLRFLVNTRLIRDADIVAGLSEYTREEAPRSLPQVRAEQSAVQKPYVPRSEASSGDTDVDLFICEAQRDNQQALDFRDDYAQRLIDSGLFGHLTAKVWGSNLYQEIAADTLAGKVSVVVDMAHPESLMAGELVALARPGSRGMKVVQLENRGTASPWRISVVICP